MRKVLVLGATLFPFARSINQLQTLLTSFIVATALTQPASNRR